MSWEHLENFFKFLLENEQAQTKVKGFGGDLDKLREYAKGLGYDFSLEELGEGRNKGLKKFKAGMKKQLQQPNASVSPGMRAFYDFIKLSESDENVAKQVAEIGAGTPEKIIAYGKEKGFIFNEQDMKDIAKSILDSSEELSDEELEAVSGGVVFSVVGAVCAVAAVAVGAVAAGAAVVGAACAVVNTVGGFNSTE